MTWQQVIIVAIFVASGTVLSLKGHETFAATALGAAAGFVSQPFFRRNTPPGKEAT